MVARAVFQDLRAHQIDVFMDVESISSGQFDTIIKHQILTAAIGYGKDDAATYCRRGKIQYMNGDLAAASADLTEALREQPDFPQASYLRGRARRDLGDPVAREDLQIAAESDSAWGQRARESIEAMSSPDIT